jgi:hypothetical protein
MALRSGFGEWVVIGTKARDRDEQVQKKDPSAAVALAGRAGAAYVVGA